MTRLLERWSHVVLGGADRKFELSFGWVWFLMLQSVREVLVSIHTKFEVSRCLVCLTIEINICSTLLITDIFP